MENTQYIIVFPNKQELNLSGLIKL